MLCSYMVFITCLPKTKGIVQIPDDLWNIERQSKKTELNNNPLDFDYKTINIVSGKKTFSGDMSTLVEGHGSCTHW